MTTISIDRVQFVQNDIPTRLHNLAAHLTKINLLSTETTQPDEAIRLIRESQYFIEWTAREMDIDTAAELVDLMRVLSGWKLNWESTWSDATARNQVTVQASSWSQRVLEMSGKLNEPAAS
ncbi:hypothetical protein F7734_12825 [Scytonema sp. UIC 10036]|uniref:hypothetical protein n=1 Tax=Scytonema sp. UIC 10036 TaxID=2304196 RepID=UPI0012DA4A94|nr:hypothetical protein [Scytonema sp. UIC 10036]MUG93265.1 hypothetical protein [Scytonema sp. UIC 10036]